MWLVVVVLSISRTVPAKDAKVVAFDQYSAGPDPLHIPNVCTVANVDLWLSKQFVTHPIYYECSRIKLRQCWLIVGMPPVCQMFVRQLTHNGEVSDLLKSMTCSISHTLKTTLEFVHSSMRQMLDFAAFSVNGITLAVDEALKPAYDNGRMRAVMKHSSASLIVPLHKQLKVFGNGYHKLCKLDSAHVLPEHYTVVWFKHCLTRFVC